MGINTNLIETVHKIPEPRVFVPPRSSLVPFEAESQPQSRDTIENAIIIVSIIKIIVSAPIPGVSRPLQYLVSAIILVFSVAMPRYNKKPTQVEYVL